MFIVLTKTAIIFVSFQGGVQQPFRGIKRQINKRVAAWISYVICKHGKITQHGSGKSLNTYDGSVWGLDLEKKKHEYFFLLFFFLVCSPLQNTYWRTGALFSLFEEQTFARQQNTLFVEKCYALQHLVYLRGNGVHTGWERIKVSCAESWRRNSTMSITRKYRHTS